jgi:hypothetical protein
MVESNSMLSTAATNITLNDTSTGTTKRIADRDIPVDPTRLLRPDFIIRMVLKVWGQVFS